jgi:hypothetical protein
MALIRYILIGLIVYLITRSFIKYGRDEKTSIKKPEPDKVKKVSRKTGEYIDYEDPDK